MVGFIWRCFVIGIFIYFGYLFIGRLGWIDEGVMDWDREIMGIDGLGFNMVMMMGVVYE